jgi:glc operon protein GlcG
MLSGQGQLMPIQPKGIAMPLTLQEAQAVITGAHERAARIAAPVTVAVVDEGGHLQALGRMNGAPPLSAQVAEAKAATVALFRRDGAALRTMQENSPAFFAQLDRAVRVRILTGAGAALIMRGDTVLGALAVSGAMAPGQDDECAEAALAVLAP